jgi:hypothetical protein
MLRHGMHHAILVRHGIALFVSGNVANVQTRVESMSCASHSKILAGQPWAKPGHDSWGSLVAMTAILAPIGLDPGVDPAIHTVTVIAQMAGSTAGSSPGAAMTNRGILR